MLIAFWGRIENDLPKTANNSRAGKKSIVYIMGPGNPSDKKEEYRKNWRRKSLFIHKSDLISSRRSPEGNFLVHSKLVPKNVDYRFEVSNGSALSFLEAGFGLCNLKTIKDYHFRQIIQRNFPVDVRAMHGKWVKIQPFRFFMRYHKMGIFLLLSISIDESSFLTPA